MMMYSICFDIGSESESSSDTSSLSSDSSSDDSDDDEIDDTRLLRQIQSKFKKLDAEKAKMNRSDSASTSAEVTGESSSLKRHSERRSSLDERIQEEISKKDEESRPAVKKRRAGLCQEILISVRFTFTLVFDIYQLYTLWIHLVLSKRFDTIYQREFAYFLSIQNM